MAQYFEYETQRGKYWRVSGYLGVDEATGKQKNINKRGFERKKDAQLYYSRAKLEFEGGQYAPHEKALTYEQVYLEWFDQYKIDVKENTCFTTQRIFELHVLPALGHYKIDKVNKIHLQKLINQWHKKYSRYKKLFNYTCKVLNYAVKQEYIKQSPQSKVTIPTKKVERGKPKPTKDFYTKDELESFMTILETEDSYKWITFFRILAFTGIRRGEALALTWNDINFKEMTLTINKTLALGLNNNLLIQSPKTKESNRTITLDPKTVKTLQFWRNEQSRLLIGFGFNARKPKQLLFSKWKDNSPLDLSSPRNNLVRICDKHNFDMVNIHGFRHTHCSLLFEAGVPMQVVQERLGHSDIQTTMNIYTHVTENSRDNSAELFANYINF